MASRFESAFAAYRIARGDVPAFDASGAFRWGSRWTHPGRYVIHAAENYSLAVLETLVHFNLGELPPRLIVVQLTIPAEVSREVLKAEELPDWHRARPYAASRSYGDKWYDEGRSAVLIVPSVLSPFERNVLINAQQAQSRSIEVGEPYPASLDERLRALLAFRRTKS